MYTQKLNTSKEIDHPLSTGKKFEGKSATMSLNLVVKP
jgi:hypothetical protein